MLVHRIESHCGLGPYSYFGHSIHDDLRRVLYSYKHIDPVTDGIPRCMLNRFPFFAFKTFEQLHCWFRDAIPYLKDFYYCVYQVDDEEFFEGESQLVFDRTTSILLSKTLIA